MGAVIGFGSGDDSCEVGELNGKEGSEEGIVVLFGIRSGIRE